MRCRATARQTDIKASVKTALALAAAIVVGACAPLQPPQKNPAGRYYVVQPGDNIHSIAFLFVTTPQQLQLANPRIDTARLQPGMRLTLPLVLPDNGGNYAAPDGPVVGSSEFIWPLKSFKVSSRFGMRRGRLHAGIDLRAPRGTPIHAAAAGKVVFAGYSGGYGRMIVIDHGRGIQTAYAHNSRNRVATGQRVRQGEVIGHVGRSGNATGNHVHFEFRRHGRPLDPARQLQARL